ncbi:hypothetical protein [Rubripirellula lacrimiformis]|nr:hypothetical protein [Rubripirellula lacrimiformis]
MSKISRCRSYAPSKVCKDAEEQQNTRTPVDDLRSGNADVDRLS